MLLASCILRTPQKISIATGNAFLYRGIMKTEHTMHPVKEWLAKTGRKQSWLAAQIGRTESHLSRIIKLVEPASLVDRMAIQAATSGDVKADQWPDVAP